LIATFAFVEKRLGERMVAARMAIAFLKQIDTEASATLPAELIPSL